MRGTVVLFLSAVATAVINVTENTFFCPPQSGFGAVRAKKDGRFSISSLGFSPLCHSRCNCNVTLWGLCVGGRGGLPPEKGRQSKYQLMTAGETGPKGLLSPSLPMAKPVNWNCGSALNVSPGRLHFHCLPLSHSVPTSCQWIYKLQLKMKSDSPVNSSWCEVKLYPHASFF